MALFYLQERSVEEAAAILGVSIGTLKSRLFRGREMLLKRWSAAGGGAPGAEDVARSGADSPAVPPARRPGVAREGAP